MNGLEKEKRLKELLEHNIRNEKVGTTIAITGAWGVGKTFFWNKFLKSVTDKEIEDKRIFIMKQAESTIKVFLTVKNMHTFHFSA